MKKQIKAVEMINGHIYGNLYLNVELAKPREKMESYKKIGYGERLAQQGRYSFVTNSNKKILIFNNVKNFNFVIEIIFFKVFD